MSNIPILSRSSSQQPGSRTRNESPAQVVGKPVPGKKTAAAQEMPRQAGRKLADIPVAILTEHSAWAASGTWQGVFDCAVWLRTPAGLSHPAQLVLKYVDNSGEKFLQIDRCQPGVHNTVLLNGSISLTINARVRDIGLYLLGTTDTAIALEEWHFTPQQRRSS